MRWTLPRQLTSDDAADGKVVWSWRLDAGAKSAGDDPRATGARKPDPRGEYEGTR